MFAFTLRPNWEILKKYGYKYPDYNWINNPSKLKDETLVVFDHLNRIPIELEETNINLEIREYANGINDSIFDTFAYFLLSQADEYYSKLINNYDLSATIEQLNEFAQFVKLINEPYNCESITIKTNTSHVSISNPEVISLLKEITNRFISRPGFIPPVIMSKDGTTYKFDDLLSEQLPNIPPPSLLSDNSLKMIFILKIREFINNETSYYHSKSFYTRKQRVLIHDMGVRFKIFQDDEKLSDKDHLKHFYHDNIRSFINSL